MESKKISSVDALCASLRTAIENKKINPKTHAKLSWKLQDLLKIS
jgi:predicted outer membrane protein